MIRERKSMNNVFERFALPSYESIPDVGLYLEQVVRYINGFFTDFPEMQVTASMITNYVKKKIVPKTGRKTYGRGHIAAFLFIAMAKSVLSMNHLRLIFTRCEGLEPAVLYGTFRLYMQRVLQPFSGEGIPADAISADTESEAFLPAMPAGELRGETAVVLERVCTAIAHQMYLERLLNDLQEG